MTILEKMKEVARLVALKKYSPTETNAILRAVAKETGFKVSEVRRVYNAALLVAGGK